MKHPQTNPMLDADAAIASLFVKDMEAKKA
jgi:hypothetical protein